MQELGDRPTRPFPLVAWRPRGRLVTAAASSRRKGRVRDRRCQALGRAALASVGRSGEGAQFALPNCITMEEYETFCKKHLARIQGEFMENGMSPIVERRNVSLIRFNGVPVLSPLLTLEKKKELQQDRQKALDLERWRQNSKQRLLLTRVEEIVANVQMKKMSSQSDLDQFEKENIHLDLESEALSGSATEPCSLLPNSTAFDAKPVDTQGAAIRNTFEGTEPFIPPTPTETSSSSLETRIGSGGPFSSLPSPPPSKEIAKKDSTDPGLGAGEGTDPYVMSLQNLLKKSREYIQREQTRRSLRSSSKRNSPGSHPDKENSAGKMNELGKERGKLTGRNTPVPTPEKPGLIKPSAPQPASTSKNHSSGVTSPSFSKVDIPMRSGTPPILDSDSDEDFKNLSLFGKDSMLWTFTGSYSKLPSPEPSLSPKMHRRRLRPSSVGHIVITNPVNAYELSPKAKGRAADLITQEASAPVPNLSADLVPTSPRKAQVFDKSSSDTFNELVVGKSNEACPLLAHQQESGSSLAHPTVEGESTLENGAVSSSCLANLSPWQLQDGSGALLTQNPAKTNSPSDKVKGSVVTELNKSYDVQHPSPLQMQIRPPLDTLEVTFGNEQMLENGLEKVKCRLELEVDAVQKENTPRVVPAETDVPERRWPHDQRTEAEAGGTTCPAVVVVDSRAGTGAGEAPEGDRRAGAEIKRGKKHNRNSVALEWRKITDTNLLESVLNQVEAAHNTNLENEGFVNAGSPFYLWEQPASGKSVVVSRSISRSKMRWSQVYSPAMKRRFNKISALAKGFLTRRLLQTEKLKHLRQTVHASERMSILRQDREIRKEKMLRQLDKAKSPRDKVALSTATQKSLDRKKYIKVLQPSQGQNAPIQRLLSRQGTSKASVKGAEQNRKKPSDHRVPSKAFSGEYLPEESQERSQMLRQPKKAAFPWLGSGLAIVLQRSPCVPSRNAGR
ncbi:hypothetical protein E2320_012109 [Naja naja]|nr:hypothetical protein E2320_012109 [Naja naja]